MTPWQPLSVAMIFLGIAFTMVDWFFGNVVQAAFLTASTVILTHSCSRRARRLDFEASHRMARRRR